MEKGRLGCSLVNKRAEELAILALFAHKSVLTHG